VEVGAAAATTYNLEPEFEAVVLYWCCTRPTFWTRIGAMLDPSALEHKWAKTLLKTCRQVANERGAGPSSVLEVSQRLSRQVHDGRLTRENVCEIAEFFEYADATVQKHNPTVEMVVGELVPLVRARVSGKIAETALDDYQKGKFDRTRTLIDTIDSIGATTQITCDVLDESAFDDIARYGAASRLPTPIFEVNDIMGGGVHPETLSIVVAGPGAGKSMYLIDQTVLQTFHNPASLTCFATLELPLVLQKARIISNVVGVPITPMLEIEADRKRAQERFRYAKQFMGTVEFADFAPQTTQVKDVTAWVNNVQQRRGRAVDLVVIDYADKLGDARVKADNTYLAMMYVYEGLRRDIAVDLKTRVWSASQSKSRDNKATALVDIQHVADSMHKIRVVDTCVTASAHESEDGLAREVSWFVAKSRLTEGRQGSAPLPADFGQARVVTRAERFRWGDPGLPA
jgi:hypothetical protein